MPVHRLFSRPHVLGVMPVFASIAVALVLAAAPARGADQSPRPSAQATSNIASMMSAVSCHRDTSKQSTPIALTG
jgi:hypothetical protein